jgi:SPP1 family predicted phage head-tail adaptor
MRAGDLDRRIIIQRLTTGESPSGEPIETWNAVATVWAKVEQQSGREFFATAQEVSERKTVFRIRYMPDLTVLDRVIYPVVDLGSPPEEPPAASVYSIGEVRELGRREGIELHATAPGQ